MKDYIVVGGKNSGKVVTLSDRWRILGRYRLAVPYDIPVAYEYSKLKPGDFGNDTENYEINKWNVVLGQKVISFNCLMIVGEQIDMGIFLQMIGVSLSPSGKVAAPKKYCKAIISKVDYEIGC